MHGEQGAVLQTSLGLEGSEKGEEVSRGEESLRKEPGLGLGIWAGTEWKRGGTGRGERWVQ